MSLLVYCLHVFEMGVKHFFGTTIYTQLCHFVTKNYLCRVHLDALLGTSCCQHLGQGGVGVARVKAVMQSQRIRPHVLGNEERCHKREGESSFLELRPGSRSVRYTARAPKNQRCLVETERQFDIHTHTI
jgi:hypothetical protein